METRKIASRQSDQSIQKPTARRSGDPPPVSARSGGVSGPAVTMASIRRSEHDWPDGVYVDEGLTAASKGETAVWQSPGKAVEAGAPRPPAGLRGRSVLDSEEAASKVIQGITGLASQPLDAHVTSMPLPVLDACVSQMEKVDRTPAPPKEDVRAGSRQRRHGREGCGQNGGKALGTASG